MKTMRSIALLACVLALFSCGKDKGPEKSGGYPKEYVYTGLAMHPSKYYRWNGGNSFTELPGVHFPEYAGEDSLEAGAQEYYDLFHPVVSLTLESDSTLRFRSREVDGFPEVDTIIPYIHEEISIVIGELEPGTPFRLFFNADLSILESRGYMHNFNFYDPFAGQRDYFGFGVREGDRGAKTELELLDEIVAADRAFLLPNDTIQLKLYEVVYELQ